MFECKNLLLSATVRRCSLVLIALWACTFRPSIAQDTVTCENELQQAEAEYIEGSFDEAIRTVLECLESPNVETSQQVEAYRLLALALIRQDELPEARAAIVELLDVNPEYEPDPIADPPAYTALVDIVKQQVQPVAEETVEPPPEESWFRSNLRWLVSGGAVVVGSVLAIVLSQGGGDEPPSGSPSLPPPPDVP